MMNGWWLLLVLMFLTALPALAAFFWLRRMGSPWGGPWFLAALGAGGLSVILAGLGQFFFPAPAPVTGSAASGPGTLIFGILVRVALVEEVSRLLVLLPLFRLYRRLGGADAFNLDRESLAAGVPARNTALWSAGGLAAGLGFAVFETLAYGASNLSSALIRAVTAAPLHAACGARIGASLAAIPSSFLRASALFLGAVFIHGAYNFFIIHPGMPSFLAVPLALSALGASLASLRASPSS
jgi:RsiW-degrading membrane proteinase PrsW (M82 family)